MQLVRYLDNFDISVIPHCPNIASRQSYVLLLFNSLNDKIKLHILYRKPFPLFRHSCLSKRTLTKLLLTFENNLTEKVSRYIIKYLNPVSRRLRKKRIICVTSARLPLINAN